MHVLYLRSISIVDFVGLLTILYQLFRILGHFLSLQVLLNLRTNANITAQTAQIAAFCVGATRAAQPVLVAVLGASGGFDSEISLCLIQVDLCLLINGAVTKVSLLN